MIADFYQSISKLGMWFSDKISNVSPSSSLDLILIMCRRLSEAASAMIGRRDDYSSNSNIMVRQMFAADGNRVFSEDSDV